MVRSEKGSAKGALVPDALAAVSEALSCLDDAAIQITVHDVEVMQIGVTERTRLAD